MVEAEAIFAYFFLGVSIAYQLCMMY